jgi:cytosine/adenosine deaminase-related metal-dependent hydrolase
MRKISADYIFPIASKPLKNGLIIADDNGIIIDVLPCLDMDIVHDVEYYKGIICPGFINSHCHLELSFFKGMLAEHTGLDVFIRDILALKRPDLDVIHQSIADAEAEMLKNGIVAVGDISNGNTTYLQKEKRNMMYHTFIEVFAFDPAKSSEVFANAIKLFGEYPDGLNKSITPHAPYSVSDKLFQMIHDFAQKNHAILSIHNQECDGENDLFKSKSGTIFERIKSWGTDMSSFHATGETSIQSYLHKMPQDSKILLVHNTVTSPEDIHWAMSNHEHLNWCFCPNANLYIENKLPDYQAFINANARCVVGTDSYASNWSLSILDELKTISNHAPSIPLETLLQWATHNGAEFLNYDTQLGTLEKGKQPGINLIYDLDIALLQLNKDSKVKRIL